MKKEKFLVDQQGKKTAVVIPIKQYEQMLEDLHDLAIVAARREEPTISMQDMLHRLGK